MSPVAPGRPSRFEDSQETHTWCGAAAADPPAASLQPWLMPIPGHLRPAMCSGSQGTLAAGWGLGEDDRGGVGP